MNRTLIGLALSVLLCGAALGATTRPDAAATTQPDEDCFAVTLVIGYSQVGAGRGGWFVAGGAFLAEVGADKWQLLWAGGAGVDRWQDPDFPGWRRPLVSPCPRNSGAPDRIVLSISGPYGDDETRWAEAIEKTLAVIRARYPSARQIVLQPVVGGPDGKATAPPGQPGGRVRASWQHAHIVNAIEAVVRRHGAAHASTADAAAPGDGPATTTQADAAPAVRIVVGFFPQVRSAEDYSDALGHLTPAAAAAIGPTIGRHYAQRDAQCRAQGHPHCGKPAAAPPLPGETGAK